MLILDMKSLVSELRTLNNDLKQPIGGAAPQTISDIDSKLKQLENIQEMLASFSSDVNSGTNK